MKHPKHLKELLAYFDDFTKTCRKRLIRGAKTYGDDWKRKDNLKERDEEYYDIVNYTILDFAQRRYKKKFDTQR